MGRFRESSPFQRLDHIATGIEDVSAVSICLYQISFQPLPGLPDVYTADPRKQDRKTASPAGLEVVCHETVLSPDGNPLLAHREFVALNPQLLNGRLAFWLHYFLFEQYD